jgi:RNA polymerase sigma factor (sigma-70 family)
MRTGGLRKVLEHLRLADGGLSDAQLLARFRDSREEAAFAALVRRHGPMVLGVCRRILGHAQDAEDAFQATFFVLARKAATVVRGEALAGWLCRVAYRTAREAKGRVLKRRAHERQVEQMPHPEVGPTEAQDWRPVLDRALDCLPKKYRVAVILCDLEGKSRREAARQLGLSEGTFSSQLTRGRRLLAKRLVRCGVSLSGGALAAALSEGTASAQVPVPLASSTVKAAVLIAAGQAAAVATPAALLMNEVLKAMLMTKLKVYVATAVVAALVGAGGLVYRAAGQTPRAESAPQAYKTVADRPLSELELLRREVEILKLQMEVMQAELRALKGRGAATTSPVAGSTFREKPDSPTLPSTALNNELPSRPPVTPTAPRSQLPKSSADATGLPPAAPAASTSEPAPPSRTNLAPRAPGAEGLNAAVSPEQEVEAALKAFRDARASGDPEAKRHAASALEKALKKLRQQ